MHAPDRRGLVLSRFPARGRKWLLALGLCLGLVLVSLFSLMRVDEAAPGMTAVIAGAPATAGADRLERVAGAKGRASRSQTTTTSTTAPGAAPADPTTTTGVPPPPTTALPAVPAPHTHHVAAVKATTTTRPKPVTTTTAKRRPKPTTTTSTTTTAPSNHQEGEASYYDAAYHSEHPHICAHRTIAFGTSLTVTNVGNGKRTTCTVGDRGPYVDGRIIDLSPHTFSEIAAPSEGRIPVRIEW